MPVLTGLNNPSQRYAETALTKANLLSLIFTHPNIGGKYEKQSK